MHVFTEHEAGLRVYRWRRAQDRGNKRREYPLRYHNDPLHRLYVFRLGRKKSNRYEHAREYRKKRYPEEGGGDTRQIITYSGLPEKGPRI